MIGCGGSILVATLLVFGYPSADVHADPGGSGKPTRVAQGPPAPPQIVPPKAIEDTPPADLPANVEQPPPPACDAQCIRRNADIAAQACVPLIEARAPVDYDWLSRPFGGMFTQAEQPGKDAVIRYRGDLIRALVQNQWLRHAYECSWDYVNNRIVGVRFTPGRLVPPDTVAQTARQGGDAAQGLPSNNVQARTPEEAARLIRQALANAARKQQAHRKVRRNPSVAQRTEPAGTNSPLKSIEQIQSASRHGNDLIRIEQVAK